MPVKIDSVDVSKIAVGKVEDNMYIKSQKQALLSYDSDQLVVQTPHFGRILWNSTTIKFLCNI